MTMAKKIEMPEYILDNTIRHLERIIELGRPVNNSSRACEAFRLACIDIATLKRLKAKHSRHHQQP